MNSDEMIRVLSAAVGYAMSKDTAVIHIDISVVRNIIRLLKKQNRQIDELMAANELLRWVLGIIEIQDTGKITTCTIKIE